MANDTLNIPRQNSYSASLTQALAADASALTINVDSVPVTTIPAGVYLEMTINPKKDFTQQEVVLVESISVANSTLTVKSGGRAQDRHRGDSPTALEHSVGSTITLSNPYSLWVDIELAIENKLDAVGGGTLDGDYDFTTDDPNTTFRVPNMTTTERDNIPTPLNGMLIYNTTTGEFQYYDGGAWQDVGMASVPNMSETVAGIGEIATVAQQGTAQSIGETGARLLPANSNLVKTSSGAGDENKIAVLDSTGKYAAGFIPDPASATSSKKFVDQFPAGEAVDGSTTPQAVYISDGTGGRTTGRFYKADANDTTNMAVLIFGFVDVNAATPGTNYNVTYGGVIGGFTGLTRGVDYYLSNTAGAITPTPPTPTAVPIGVAVSITQIYIKIGTKSIYATYSFGAGSGTVDTELLLGFRPVEAEVFVIGTGSGCNGWWHAGMGTGASVGVNHRTGDIVSAVPYGGYDGNYVGKSAILGGSYTLYSVIATSKNSITIRRNGTHNGGTVYLKCRA
jgi:hypothetical protein